MKRGRRQLPSSAASGKRDWQAAPLRPSALSAGAGRVESHGRQASQQAGLGKELGSQGSCGRCRTRRRAAAAASQRGGSVGDAGRRRARARVSGRPCRAVASSTCTQQRAASAAASSAGRRPADGRYGRVPRWSCARFVANTRPRAAQGPSAKYPARPTPTTTVTRRTRSPAKVGCAWWVLGGSVHTSLALGHLCRRLGLGVWSGLR